MELRQLKYFIAVAEELNFSRAAERCHIAQPPLSQQIKKLEEELGVRLFDRTNRKVSITAEGGKFLCVARNTLETLECGVDQVRMMSRGEIGRLRVGFLNSGIQTDFPKAVTAFRKAHPGIILDIREMQSADQNAALRSGELDAGLSHHCYADHVDLEARVFLVDKYYLAVHEEHPLAGKSSVNWADLDNEPYIMFSREHYPTAYDRAIACFREHNIMPRIVQEAKTHHTKLSLIAAGMGIGFVPERMRAVCPDCVRMLSADLDGETSYSSLKLVWKKGEKTPALRFFLEVMGAFCQDNGFEVEECWKLGALNNSVGGGPVD
ncbi:MAG: LysR family transcriptional regulator [Pseudodesulfovibrio sp.]|nr:LysR family transcriptional regulator [Pseudodesulfovibrio sp.]